jgi:epoxyqueuosine reductase
MPRRNPKTSIQAILEQSRRLGATLAGVASVAALRQSPSHLAENQLCWPPEARTVVVMALAHPADDPERDWWDGRPGGSPGNRKLMAIGRKLSRWIQREMGCRVRALPYGIENGGKFLKDAAVLAGMGAIGRNNLLITPNHGPRLRMRALMLDIDLDVLAQLPFAPCTGCDAPCHRACPQDAFQSGRYHRPSCLHQMAKDEAEADRMVDIGVMVVRDRRVRYCRACELACPVARKT